MTMLECTIFEGPRNRAFDIQVNERAHQAHIYENKAAVKIARVSRR